MSKYHKYLLPINTIIAYNIFPTRFYNASNTRIVLLFRLLFFFFYGPLDIFVRFITPVCFHAGMSRITFVFYERHRIHLIRLESDGTFTLFFVGYIYSWAIHQTFKIRYSSTLISISSRHRTNTQYLCQKIIINTITYL